jgi:hypothetical protein
MQHPTLDRRLRICLLFRPEAGRGLEICQDLADIDRARWSLAALRHWAAAPLKLAAVGFEETSA